MTVQDISLDDKFDLTKTQVLLNGTQALVRLMITQQALDARAGLNTAGFVTGYRGSPLGAVDMQMRRAKAELDAANVRFQEGLNEDLAATALWGSQQAELRGEGKFDGVFGLWYGKGPGVDRSGDVFRHANMAGTSQNGGVLVAMGDDHTGESSTVLHQSELALMDAYMPIVSPAGVQEILDLGLYGLALSRFSGCWVGVKTMKDTIETSAVVQTSLDSHRFTTPEIDLPADGLNIRLIDTPTDQEARLLNHKVDAARAFARANRIDRRHMGRAGAKIGFVAAGKNWLDLTHALSLLNIDADAADRLGITTYKIAQVFPLDMDSLKEWAEGLDLIVVIEEKRKIIEGQIKDALYNAPHRPRIYGGQDAQGALFPATTDLNPVFIAERLGDILLDEGCITDAIQAGRAALREARRADNAPQIAARIPYFCAGCPHNSSTKIPEGSRAYAGIGCHYMVQWMGRDTSGFTHMGGEGANWIGEAPFSTRAHVFQNIGDGTYNHSGLQAIRASVASGVNITYKVLYNDAVAMTGGQANDGGLGAERIAAELAAFGVAKLAIVYDEKEGISGLSFPQNASLSPRADLMRVQEDLAQTPGTTALLYIQTCAAEKRRRRKRGKFPDPDQRIFINTDVCEGCGDCGVQSNCVAIVPVETPLGRKRAIDQSACNKDYSCLKGFCPSFVTVEGAQPKKKSGGKSVDIPDLPMPTLPQIQGTWNMVIAGVGGTGVITLGAILAQAAQMDGKGAGMMEMAGLAQKGGAVNVHCRIANDPGDISAIRVATGEADALIGGDLVVSAMSKTLGLTFGGRTGAVVNSHDVVTGEFTRNREFRLPHDQMCLAVQARLKEKATLFDASALALAIMGDTIFANMVVMGASFQQGLIPISLSAIEDAIRLNGAAVDANLRAFTLGRWAIADPDAALSHIPVQSAALPATLDDKIAYRMDHLRAYQSARLARKYERAVARFEDPALKEAVATSYHKLLSYKDEYEVARLLLQTKAKAQDSFDGDLKLRYHLAPPILGGTDTDGRPRKRAFGEGIARLFPLLAAMKHLRGTPFDIFGKTAERRAERAWIKDYEADMELLRALPQDADQAAALDLAALPQSIRGFGPVKEKAMQEAREKRAELRARLGV
jgi:indolepyruvate ferredoxin oxidoreductase